MDFQIKNFTKYLCIALIMITLLKIVFEPQIGKAH